MNQRYQNTATGGTKSPILSDNDDWVKYGDTVLDMNNIYDNEDLRTIGIVCAILPKENNYHLL